MFEDYILIKTAYDSLYNTMLSKGKLPLKQTELGYWGISTADDIFHLFKTLNLNKKNRFIDLGSGDGKVTLIASLFMKEAGIECDPELISHSRTIQNKLGMRAEFIQGNFLLHDLSGYDTLFIHPDQHMHALEPKLMKELKGKLVVYGPHYHPTTLKKEAEFLAHTTQVTIYSKQF